MGEMECKYEKMIVELKNKNDELEKENKKLKKTNKKILSMMKKDKNSTYNK